MESSILERSGLRNLFNLQMESGTSIGFQGRGQDGRYERGWGMVHTGWTLHSWGRPAQPGSEHRERTQGTGTERRNIPRRWEPSAVSNTAQRWVR